VLAVSRVMLDFNDPVVDEATVRSFIEIIHTYAARIVNSNGGVLQLCRIHPTDKNVVPTRFNIGDVTAMSRLAIADARNGHNVYIEGRLVRPGLSGRERGELSHTFAVFAFIIDSDADKNKSGNVTANPTLAIETSPGNYQLWYFLDRGIEVEQAKVIGEAIRRNSGADQDTGVITQCYRVAGTPNYPNEAKRKRGRVTVEATRIVEHSGKLWSPEELLNAFPPITPLGNHDCHDSADDAGPFDEATLPADLLDLIRNGVDKGLRSEKFHRVVAQLKTRRWDAKAIAALFEKYPDGIAQKYAGRLRDEVERSYQKISDSAAPGKLEPPDDGSGNGYTLRTIRIIPGQLPRVASEAEQALIAAGVPILHRGGRLMHPVVETVPAADGRKTIVAKLRELGIDSMLDRMAEIAIFQRFNAKRGAWIDVDPPRQVAATLLSREGRWTVPRVTGVITTPTLRPDGSLLRQAGYDMTTQLYHLPSLDLPDLPDRPSREQALAAHALLTDLLAEFSFVGPLDRAVALAGILTVLVRGSLQTAPMYVVRAHTPGTGKSYLVDVIAAIATGRLCPVITASKSEEETEKRLGAVILSGASIVSLDNCDHDLGGPLLCQLTERPLVKIRILGRSEMPECECHTAVLATGNNVMLTGDMVRRGLECNLDTLDERPELRTFQHNPLKRVLNDRGAYVAAAFTMIRAYIAAGSPSVCKPFGSYAGWSVMVRSPLVWLGEPDPVESTDSARTEDPELASIRELFSLWTDYFDLDRSYTTSRIVEGACEAPAPDDFNRRPLKALLLQVAGDRGGGVSTTRLGRWLRRISGRVVDGHRLTLSHPNKALAAFSLSRVS
jgi:hypothetical protein